MLCSRTFYFGAGDIWDIYLTLSYIDLLSLSLIWPLVLPSAEDFISTSSLCLSIYFLCIYKWLLITSFSLLTSASCLFSYFTISLILSYYTCSFFICLSRRWFVYWRSWNNSCSYSIFATWLSISSFVLVWVSWNIWFYSAIFLHSL